MFTGLILTVKRGIWVMHLSIWIPVHKNTSCLLNKWYRRRHWKFENSKGYQKIHFRWANNVQEKYNLCCQAQYLKNGKHFRFKLLRIVISEHLFVVPSYLLKFHRGKYLTLKVNLTQANALIHGRDIHHSDC